MYFVWHDNKREGVGRCFLMGCETFKMAKMYRFCWLWEISYIAILGAKDDFFLMLCFLMLFKKRERSYNDCVEEDVVKVVMETKSMFATFARFYDHGLYFIGKFPLVSRIKQWSNWFMMPNCVEGCVCGSKRFLWCGFPIVRTSYCFVGKGINLFW